MGKMKDQWSRSFIDQVEKKTFKKEHKSLTSWVVKLVIQNDEKARKTRYMFFTEDGAIFRTNTTGVLK